MLIGHLIQQLFYTILTVVLGMVLWGAVPTDVLFEMVFCFILVRGYWLFTQWRYREPDEPQWVQLSSNLAEAMLPAPSGADDPPPSIDSVLHSPAYQRRLRRLHARTRVRDHWDIVSEAVYLVAVMPTAVLVGLMLSSNIVTYTGMARWTVVGCVAAAFGLHFLPSWLPSARVRQRLLARTVIAATVLAATLSLAVARHPYLFKFGAERRQMLAARMLELGPTVEASRHADLLFAYAQDLENAGRLNLAADYYERGLGLAPRNPAAHLHVAEIYAHLGRDDEAARHRTMAAYAAPKPGVLSVARAQVRPLDVLPANAKPSFTICLVPFGDVPASLLDWMGNEIQARLQVPVFRFHQGFTLPAADRHNGLAGPAQWKPLTLWRTFLAQGKPFPRLPVQYILVVPVDLYDDGANFVFAEGLSGHAVVSFARLYDVTGTNSDPDTLLVDRLVKTALSCSIKALGVPPSTDPGCVTAYSNGLAELDLKAPIPSPATDKLYRVAIRQFELLSREKPN